MGLIPWETASFVSHRPNRKRFSGINRDIKLTGLVSVVEWKARSPTAIGEKQTPNPKLNVRLWKSV